MQKLRMKTKNLDVLIRYIESAETRVKGQWETLFNGIITFKLRYPYLNDKLLQKYKEKLIIEFQENQNSVYFASSPNIMLASRKGGEYKSTFVHPTYEDDIVDNMKRYVDLLTDLDDLINKGFMELSASEISF
ncbi:hypothetical protein ND861_07085 [Leptospira sp. 2 VSF19]|uniref:Uncharacterized protein n=1 Tax=Leptospira soteropolitanensis TaxID=2950025 RepID=A0AAW5VLL0_9LEPT|nr:hypothetical protein [Leptospira soteropolitanensis]MCW7494656.1 hypothetical protein [Leptospira soteropolitanensis]MCW7499994.1 hypothetical protein [Leptospira soteropolitanensis]MCW7522245.1 hypothetical protein [Leptospira soteropolitanensis]MCW7526101.1 hypothetical protein [Leptospira soteropolitanensis]MCW7529787.1 hypothetical protein [Leptospira soteropolitanensis]